MRAATGIARYAARTPRRVSASDQSPHRFDPACRPHSSDGSRRCDRCRCREASRGESAMRSAPTTATAAAPSKLFSLHCVWVSVRLNTFSSLSAIFYLTVSNARGEAAAATQSGEQCTRGGLNCTGLNMDYKCITK